MSKFAAQKAKSESGIRKWESRKKGRVSGAQWGGKMPHREDQLDVHHSGDTEPQISLLIVFLSSCFLRHLSFLLFLSSCYFFLLVFFLPFLFLFSSYCYPDPTTNPTSALTLERSRLLGVRTWLQLHFIQQVFPRIFRMLTMVITIFQTNLNGLESASCKIISLSL